MRNKAELRETIFRHLDGIVTAPTAFALHQKGVLTYLLENKEVSLLELVSAFEANDGYLNVALRVLCSQGWLEQHLDNATDKISFSVTPRGEIAFPLVPLYEDVVKLMQLSGKYHPRKFEKEPYQVWATVADRYKNSYGLTLSTEPTECEVQKQVLAHIEGLLMGPAIVLLGMNGMFHKYFMESRFSPEEFHENHEDFRKILDLFAHLGWFRKVNDQYEYTEEGVFFAKRGSAYGVTVSYIPTFRHLDDLLFGNPNVLWDKPEGAPELHVDREMNVWGSGGAHATYFNVIDEIIIELFNRPIEEQPKGILDMGCGNGAFLQHMFDVIERQTARGKVLDQYPLFLVGADYNQAALKVTRANLIKADIWAKVIWGDIGRPDLLAQDLQENYNIDLKELLNVRTFLDHNRIWERPADRTPGRVSNSTGAFAFRGKRISNNEVEDNLLEHLKKWTPYVDKFGLLTMELHTIPPTLAASHLGKTAATAYDATHGFSDQYIVEVEVFHKVASEAGLYPDKGAFRRFPDSDMATISINLLRGKS
ncbi:class I SAM-dependent methyltransferase [Pontibacter sp. JH31]|uniref:Class I SAM-dependent methyltransferase n=1 Tax=Pontibacter aquaedesilientis TaxID=2766980 RepID=A0ABR7XDN0_9BACT|nr:class I SAM-dependent methyltransferase [Pontibacter aquaedesilientis]MBD1396387.1 class I SAM-dependent methyltransferase [Pontibacter aquaedesilientis]